LVPKGAKSVWVDHRIRGEKMKKITKKDSNKQKKRLEKKLDIAWSAFVRRRDRVCQKCGGIGTVAPHHAFGRRHLATRWLPENGIGLCYPCHIHWAHRDPAGFTEWFRNKIGEEKYTQLAMEHNSVVKFDNECLEAMLDKFWKDQP
jgi:5-methylcytosine-specific restriction endonuclease McrA